VADSFDAMTSDRPYRGSIGVERALAELRGGSGSQFDPEVVRVFVDMVESQPPEDDEQFGHALKHAG
jgi:HD-GYP domain-containing protein (c-di-GMP phosphodiesterase class II)